MKGESIHALNIRVYLEIQLLDQGRIVLADPIGDHWHSLALANHNIFRLDKDGNVLWQVTRDERGKVNWSLLNELAQAKGLEGAKHRFEAIWCKNPLTGESSFDLETGTPIPDFQWKPGMQIMARADGIANNLYEIDIDTGIAVNVTPPGPKRPW